MPLNSVSISTGITRGVRHLGIIGGAKGLISGDTAGITGKLESGLAIELAHDDLMRNGAGFDEVSSAVVVFTDISYYAQRDYWYRCTSAVTADDPTTDSTRADRESGNGWKFRTNRAQGWRHGTVGTMTIVMPYSL
ncbi:MAG: hypothetical protein M1483_02260 [Actinobacteria bacterium]|jgi:hypothetical protein|nr:hypothetical protein [Actinomycetota bacterium]MCL6104452.1 hypothetical protein [Actinomycetota bacterium]